ncbi:hypothetical protein ACQ4PT_045272 [Festuca glaucescens]
MAAAGSDNSGPWMWCKPGLGFPVYALPRCRAVVKLQCVGSQVPEAVLRDWCRCGALSSMLRTMYAELGAWGRNGGVPRMPEGGDEAHGCECAWGPTSPTRPASVPSSAARRTSWWPVAYPSLATTATADFDAVFAVKTRRAFLCLREAANRLCRGGGGRIVAVSSSLAVTLLPGYAASKAAVEAMVRVTAKELGPACVTVNCVAPGPVGTELFFQGKSEEVVERFRAGHPMWRLGEVDDIVPAVGFLCTDAAEWVNGQVIRVNGGIA